MHDFIWFLSALPAIDSYFRYSSPLSAPSICFCFLFHLFHSLPLSVCLSFSDSMRVYPPPTHPPPQSLWWRDVCSLSPSGTLQHTHTDTHMQPQITGSALRPSLCFALTRFHLNCCISFFSFSFLLAPTLRTATLNNSPLAGDANRIWHLTISCWQKDDCNCGDGEMRRNRPVSEASLLQHVFASLNCDPPCRYYRQDNPMGKACYSPISPQPYFYCGIIMQPAALL